MDEVVKLLKDFYETADCAECFHIYETRTTEELREHEQTCQLIKLQHRYEAIFGVDDV